MQEKTILITGFGGFVATHLFAYLYRNYPRNTYLLIQRKPENSFYAEKIVNKIYNLPALGDESLVNVNFLSCDITNRSDLERIFLKHKPDIIIHLAAQSIVSVAEELPIDTVKTNILGTMNILQLVELINTTKPCYLFYQSTDKIYGNGLDADNNTPINPVDFYGITKASAELMVKFYQKKLLHRITIVRPCNIFGYDKNTSRLIPDLILTCLKGNNPTIKKFIKTTGYSLVINFDYFPIRQFLFIEDYTKIMYDIITHAYIKEINIGTSFVYSTLQVIHFIIENDRFKGLTVNFDETTKTIEIKKQSLKQELQDFKFTSFSEALDKTINQYYELNQLKLNI
jgi:nucleoside-diphosphate-sugar epimerase